MKSVHFSSKVIRILYVAGMFALVMPAYGTDWLGGVINNADSNVDTNFTIANENIIEGPIAVKAINQDVVATIGPSAVLKSANDPDDGRLHVTADVNRQVTFDLSEWSLKFSGAADGTTKLLVSFGGEGKLVFLLGDGQRVVFAPHKKDAAGTNFFVCMNEHNWGPEVRFERKNHSSKANVEVVVGRDSCVTFVADANDKLKHAAEGSIVFDPSNLDPRGCTILRLKDCSSFLINGLLAHKDKKGRFTNEDVDFKKLAGCAATVRVCNSQGSKYTANLTVINKNSVLPRLRTEPFCDGSFDGKLFGFILGANGVLVTEDCTYLDYVACRLNCCPRVGKPHGHHGDKEWAKVDCDTCNVECPDCDCKPCDCEPKDSVKAASEHQVVSPAQPVKRKPMKRSGSCGEWVKDWEDCKWDDKPLKPCDVCGASDGWCECKPFFIPDCRLVKERNPSAFFVDGVRRKKFWKKKNKCRPIAQMVLEGCSGVYFRSGVDACGDCNEEDGFIINPHGCFDVLKAPGIGNIVFDVEGKLDVIGDSANSNVLRILSCEVEKSGCPVVIASEADCPDKKVFPKLTHEKNDEGEFLSYNKGAFLINNCVNMWDTSLLHTNKNHLILERDDLDVGNPFLHSEPTYVGGEFHKVCKVDADRPKFALHNSNIRFHESAGFTGLDIQVPNVCDAFGNNSALKFYSNGMCVDKGNGRYVILGTDEGCRSCIDGFVIDHNAHLDVFQVCNQCVPAEDHVLRLLTCPNDECFSPLVKKPVNPDECSIQTIFLGNESNISIGTAPTAKGRCKAKWCEPTTPTVIIDGAFFSFETRGGSAKMPCLTGTLGEGAIFVDQNGVFKNERNKRASISTMVVRSCNGVVDLPKTDIFFDLRVGVTDWKPNLAKDNILVKPGECFSDFTIDWMNVKTDCPEFVPYDLKCTPEPCKCPPVTDANLFKLPTILGTVDQLQVKRSRLGDQISLLVGNGGFIRELVFLTGFNSAEAPMANVVVEDFGRVGLGTAHRNVDSLEASIKLGINGVTIIAKGNGVIDFNEDVIIDNVCHIVPGPDFGQGDERQDLILTSEDEKEIRVKSTGVLDLSMFRGRNQLVEFGGNLRLVFEPGSKLILSDVSGDENRTRLRFTDTVSVNFERVFDDAILENRTPNALEERTVKWVGNGEVTFKQGATLLLPDDTFLGIESDPECSNFTDIFVTLKDQTTFDVGNDVDPGGTFQVGNRTDNGGTINFTMDVEGIGSIFQLNRQGIVAFGVGGVEVNSEIPNDWTFECLHNVNNVTVSIPQGTMRHNQIFSGDNKLASLFVIGPANNYSFSFDVVNARIQGGGNFALVNNCNVENGIRAFVGSPFPIPVTDFNGQLPGGNTTAGLFSSKDQLRDTTVFPAGSPVSGNQTVAGLSPQDMFDYLKVLTNAAYGSSKSTIAQAQLNTPVLGYVTDDTEINRVPNIIIKGGDGQLVSAGTSLRRGAVFINIDDINGDINNVIQIDDPTNM